MSDQDDVLEPILDDDVSEHKLETLITLGEWEKLYQHPQYQAMSRATKITTLHDAMSVRERKYEIQFCEIVRIDTHRGQIFLDTKLKRIRFLKKYLTSCLMWEYTGEIPPHQKPKELEGLI